MSSHGVTFRFERRGRGCWDVLLGQIHLAELSVHSSNGANPGEHWRLRAVGSETPAEACWPAHPGAGRSYRLPERIESHAISLIAAWTLDALAEAAQANTLLRRRLESAIAKLESERDILRDSLMDFDGNFASADDKRILDEFDREIAASRAVLAHAHGRQGRGLRMTLRGITMRQLTDALGMSPSAYSMRAVREGWPYRPGPANGLKGRAPRLYDVSGLPDDIRQRLLRSPAEALNAAAPELLQRLEVSTAELIDYRDMMRADCSDPDGTIADPADEAEIRSLSLEIERNQALMDQARGIEGAS